MFSFINKCNARSLTIGFFQITLQAVIHCVEKLHKCFETNPDAWRVVNGYGLQFLLLHNLERYCDKFSNKKDLQDKWKMAMTSSGKYVNLLVGQPNDKDLRAESDKENHYNSELWDQATKNFFLAYRQVNAQARWYALMPDVVEHYKRFQVRTCV
jgi:hypothetical protein